MLNFSHAVVFHNSGTSVCCLFRTACFRVKHQYFSVKIVSKLHLHQRSTAMPFLVQYICGVSLWSVVLAGHVTNNSRETCYQGYTGSDSGGSCTFDNVGLCDWKTSDNDKMKWEVNDDKNAYASAYRKDEGEKGILSSPWMCCDIDINVTCLQFRFKFDKNDGGNLTLLLCYPATECTELWSSASSRIEKGKWYHVAQPVNLRQCERFQIQFKAQKIEDSWGTETNFYLDDIVYKNTSCEERVLRPASSTAVPFSTTEYERMSFDIQAMDRAAPAVVTEVKADDNAIIYVVPCSRSYPSSAAGSIRSAALDMDDTEYSPIPSTSAVTNGENPDGTQKDGLENREPEENSKLIMIASIIAVLMLTAAIVVVVIYFRRQRPDAGRGSQKSSISRDPRSSIAMVTNDLYYLSDMPTECSREPEQNISLPEMHCPQDPDTYYSMIHHNETSRDQSRQLESDAQVHHEHDNSGNADMYCSMIHHTDAGCEKNGYLHHEEVEQYKHDNPQKCENYENVVLHTGNVHLQN